MPDFLDYYLKATSVNIGPGYPHPDVLNKRNRQCFIDKLMEMYKKNDSIEDVAAAVSELLKRINENSVSTYLPMLYF